MDFDGGGDPPDIPVNETSGGSPPFPGFPDDNGTSSDDESPKPNDLTCENRPPRQRFYHDISMGPWVVYFRPKPNGKRLNVVSISRDLEKGFPSVSHIIRVRPDKLKVVVGSLKEANAIVRSDKFTIEYRVYVPARDVECDGKVVEEGLTASDLLVSGVGRFNDPRLPSIRIIDVYQLSTAKGEGETKTYSPSNTWQITFAGTALPNYISIGKLRLTVYPFVPRVMNCLNCCKLGHTATYCSNKTRCGKCGDHHDGATGFKKKTRSVSIVVNLCI